MSTNANDSSWSGCEYKTHYAGTIDAQWFYAMFSEDLNYFIVDRRNERRDTDTGA